MGCFIDLQGQRFGRLVAVVPSHVLLTSGRRMPAWECRCDCGNETVVQGHHLRGGFSNSCGCLGYDLTRERARKHGASGTNHYRVWRAMIARCYLPTVSKYDFYGGRGIKVCDRWRFGENGKSGFECWREDMGPKSTPEHSLDRINNDGNYEPGNCRWATRLEQADNTRRGPARGVSYDKRRGRWRAYIIGRSLGRFSTEAQALEARRVALDELTAA